MKLFLCSHFSSVGSLIKEEIENKKVAFIPTASLREGYTGYVGSARKLFKKLGVGGRSMGLLDRLKSNKNNKDFFEWLDLLLKNELSSEIKAIIFNLYEDTDNKWSIELVGTFSFNTDNDDWA